MSDSATKITKKSPKRKEKSPPQLNARQSKQAAQEKLHECYKELHGTLSKTKEAFGLFKAKCFFFPEPDFNKAFKESLQQVQIAVDDMGSKLSNLFGVGKGSEEEEAKTGQSETKPSPKVVQEASLLNISADQSDVLAKMTLNITPPPSEASNDDEVSLTAEQQESTKTSGTKRSLSTEDSTENHIKRPRRSLIDDYLLKEKKENSKSSSITAEDSKSSSNVSTESSTEASTEEETKSSGDEGEAEYEVENIITFKKTGSRFMYKVSWKGYGPEECTWEPAEHLTDCSEVLLEFYKTKLIEREKTLTNGNLNNLAFPHDLDFQKFMREAFLCVIQPTETDIRKGLEVKSPNTSPMSKEEINEIIDKALSARKVERYNMYKKQLKEQILLSGVLKDRTKQQAELRKWERSINSVCSDPAKIQVENNVDLSLPPLDFVYINELKEGHGVTLPSDPLLGCSCEDCSNSQTSCCASQMNSAFAYNKAGRLKISLGTPIYECNNRCSCQSTCINRVVQKGRKFSLSIFRTSNGRGWGVKSLEYIKKDSFVVEYVGEVITSEEAERRGHYYDKKGCTYLFDLDFNNRDQNPYTVDATKYGNVSHFINHSCDPNLVVFNVWVNCLDPDLPRLALFACRDIKKGEELTFDYNSGLESEQMKVDSMSPLNEDFSEDESSTPEKSVFSNGAIKTPKGNRGLKYGKTECRCGAANCRKYFF